MAFVFQPDPSLAGFNSLTTVAFADDYQTTKLYAAWAALLTADKEKLLAWSSRQLSTLQWIGIKTVATQELSWPRSYVPIEGGYTGSVETEVYSTLYFDANTVPKPIQEACAELAGQLLDGDSTAPTGLEGFKELKVDSISIVVDPKDRLSWFQPATKNLCYKYLVNSSPINAPVKRVG